MDKTRTEIFDIPSIQLKGLGIFIIFYSVFFLYQRTLDIDRVELIILINTLALIIFIISSLKIKIGLYIFIFLIPLLNSINTIFRSRGADNILILFLALFLGFLVSKYKDRGIRFNIDRHDEISFDWELLVPLILFSAIILISSLITIYRYLNFIPLLSSKFNNIAVNISGVRAESCIHWTIKWFFNSLAGIGLALIIHNAFKKTKDIIHAVIIIAASNILVILVGLYQHYIDPTLGSFSKWVEADRINSTFTDPNALGNYVLIMFPIFIVLIIYFKRWYQRILFIALFLAFLVIALFSGSRNGLIGAVISSFIFLVLGMIRLIGKIIKQCKASRARRKSWISAGVILLVFCILFISLVSYIAVTKPELKDMYRIPKTGISLIDRSVDTVWMSYNVWRQAGFIEGFRSVSSERHFLWPQAVDMFKDHPVSGVGLGGFLIELPNYYERNNPPVKIIDFTGNYYLQILSELGITGLILIAAIFILIIKVPVRYFLRKGSSRPHRREDWFLRGFFISFISTIIVLFFGPHTNFNEILFSFWLIIGLLVVFVKIIEDEGNKSLILTSGYLCSGKKNLKLVQRICFALVLILFSTNLFISSWTSLSVNSKRIELSFAESYGFYNEEASEDSVFRWSAMDASEVIDNNKGSIIIPVKDSDPKDSKFPLFIRFFIDNSLEKVVKISNKEWNNITIDLSEYSKDQLVLTLSCSRRWTPKQRGLSNDTRELGVMVGEFKFID